MSLLNGLRILNTRPLIQGRELNTAISTAGGVPIHIPALEINPTSKEWLTQMPALNSVQQAIFISANAAIYYFSALKQHLINWPSNIKVTAIGSSTTNALTNLGICVHNYPLIADSEHLLKLETFANISEQHILLIKGCDGRAIIGDTLGARGARVIPLDVYQRTSATIIQNEHLSKWSCDEIDIILFTSQHAMHAFLQRFTNKQECLLNKPWLVISQRLADEAHLLGVKTILISQHNDIISTLIRYKKDITYANRQGR